MPQQRIELSGIVRNLPDNSVKDGSMHELINLRPRDGALRPVGGKTATVSTMTDIRFIHTISSSKKVYIGVNTISSLLSYWIETSGIPGAENTTTIPSSADMAFAALKNSLMISDKVNEIPYLLVFSEDTDTYSVFDQDFLPSDIPNLLARSLAVTSDDVAGETFDVGPDVNYGEVELSQYVKMQKDKADDGYLSGKVLVRFAWELFDGTLVKHTIPQHVSTSEITTTSAFGATYLGGTSPGWRVTTAFNAYKLQFNFSTVTSQWLIDFKAKYENIIRSLKVYVSLPKSPELTEAEERHMSYFEKEKSMMGSRIVSKVLIYDVSELKYYSPDPAQESYYLVKEFNLSQLTANSWTDIGSEAVSDLAVREQIKVDNFSHHQLFAERLFSYNERIFLGSIKNTLYSGFPLLGMLEVPVDSEVGTPYNVGIEFDIMIDSNRTCTVFTGWQEWTSRYGGDFMFSIRPGFGTTVSYYGYPDSRAVTARILVNEGSVTKLIDTIKLESYPLHNFSIVPGRQFDGDLDMYDNYTLVANKNTYYDYNRIQATELNNPFYYPAINSYRVGSGTILGMSSNTIALSTGQFGQFPIYCFTTDGIWTMSIGTGETLINAITPLSREVCNNSASITPIDGGTAFTTAKGLFILSGNQVLEISQAAEGLNTGNLPSGAESDLIYNPATSSIYHYFCTQPFLTYITGAKIAWDYINKEIIVSNASYSYSWVFSLDHKMWFKITEVFASFVNDFPRCYGYTMVGATYYKYDLNTEDFTNLIVIYAETKPLKLSLNSYKRLDRLMLQGYINNSGTYLIGLFMGGTSDNKTWVQINNTRYLPAQEPMVLNRSQHSCRSFMLAFGGRVDQEAYFNWIDIQFTDKYGDKLR